MDEIWWNVMILTEIIEKLIHELKKHVGSKWKTGDWGEKADFNRLHTIIYIVFNRLQSIFIQRETRRIPWHSGISELDVLYSIQNYSLKSYKTYILYDLDTKENTQAYENTESSNF